MSPRTENMSRSKSPEVRNKSPEVRNKSPEERKSPARIPENKSPPASPPKPDLIIENDASAPDVDPRDPEEDNEPKVPVSDRQQN